MWLVTLTAHDVHTDMYFYQTSKEHQKVVQNLVFLHRPFNSSDFYDDLHTNSRAWSLLLPSAANLPQILSKYHSFMMGLGLTPDGEQACSLQFLLPY